MPDYSDPCVMLPLVREAYYNLLNGSREERVEFRSDNGTTTSIQYGRGDINALRIEVRRLERLCNGAGKVTRRAIFGG